MGKVLRDIRAQGIPVALMGTALDCPSPALTLAQFWPGCLLSGVPLSQFLPRTWEWQGGEMELGLASSDS